MDALPGLGDQSADAIAAVVIVWMTRCFRTEDRCQRRYPTARRRQRSARVQSGDHREECAMAPPCLASHCGSRGIRYRASPKSVRFPTSPLVSGLSGYVKSFGRRQASESRRGTNPRCAGRGLWGFDVLVVPGWAVVTCARLDRMRVARASPGDHDQYPRPLAAIFGDRDRDRRR